MEGGSTKGEKFWGKGKWKRGLGRCKGLLVKKPKPPACEHEQPFRRFIMN